MSLLSYMFWDHVGGTYSRGSPEMIWGRTHEKVAVASESLRKLRLVQKSNRRQTSQDFRVLAGEHVFSVKGNTYTRVSQAFWYQGQLSPGFKGRLRFPIALVRFPIGCAFYLLIYLMFHQCVSCIIIIGTESQRNKRSLLSKFNGEINPSGKPLGIPRSYTGLLTSFSAMI
ncbi:hypothetical protein Tco_0222394, partial [Tanacetum coccineum]